MKREVRMMKRIIFMGILLFALVACDDDDDIDDVVQDDRAEFIFDFSDGANGWTGDFAEYEAGEEQRYELAFEYATLPAPLDENEGALFLTGTNLSDNLFMYVTREVGGLEPETDYNARFTVQFASNVPDGLVGIGGSPGGSVWIKAGATPNEPELSLGDMGHYQIDIDKGVQSQGGEDMMVLGDFSNDTDQDIYNLKTVTNEEPLIVTTDADGNLWLIVGTDSGFEGTTSIYYNSIHVVLDEDEFVEMDLESR